MTDRRSIPHSLRRPNRTCDRCNVPYYATKGKTCPSCRTVRPRRRPLPPDQGGDSRAFLPDPPAIQRTYTKTYAEYLAEARPSKHEVVRPRRTGQLASEVRQAIERVKAMEPPTRREAISKRGYVWTS